ncbi:MAG: uncharacterized protein KVP18_003609 [Porospora cf. gigantea A]|nr:MAG: hypothetical protein KVP18_003609 [Porospora cf. gigantea A]
MIKSTKDFPGKKQSRWRLPGWLVAIVALAAVVFLYTSFSVSQVDGGAMQPAMDGAKPRPGDSRLKLVLSKLQRLNQQVPFEVEGQRDQGPVDQDAAEANVLIEAVLEGNVVDEAIRPVTVEANAPVGDAKAYAKGNDRAVLVGSTAAPMVLPVTQRPNLRVAPELERPEVVVQDVPQVGAAPKVVKHTSERQLCAMDVRVGNEGVHTMTLELYRHELPLTVDNFVGLCLGSKNPLGQPIGLAGSLFHRVIPGFMMQGGEQPATLTGGTSIYGTSFEDEGFPFNHDMRGALSMANAGPNTNGSQFFISFKEAPWLDQKHVVFGRVVDGWELLNKVEAQPTDASDKPKSPIAVVACRILEQ